MFPSYRANQLTGFYMMGTLAVKGLKMQTSSWRHLNASNPINPFLNKKAVEQHPAIR